MITGAQIRAARALLDMTREQLADKCGLTPQAIGNIETNPKVRPHAKTIEAIEDVFAALGVEFTPRGVALRDSMVQVIEGEDAYLRMCDDIFYEVQNTGGEVLFLYADDSATREGEIEAEERIRSTGSRFRVLVEEGTTFIRWPAKEYRVIPKRFFHHNLQVIYGNKVAQTLDGGGKILIIDNASFATTARNNFDLIWQFMKALPKETKET